MASDAPTAATAISVPVPMLRAPTNSARTTGTSTSCRPPRAWTRNAAGCSRRSDVIGLAGVGGDLRAQPVRGAGVEPGDLVLAGRGVDGERGDLEHLPEWRARGVDVLHARHRHD